MMIETVIETVIGMMVGLPINVLKGFAANQISG